MLKKREDYLDTISDINVTPFVDVLLVLLVIFMITAPLFTKAIEVKLPKENLKSSKLSKVKKFIVSINKNGKYYIKNQRISTKKLLKKVIIWREKNPNETAFVAADRAVKYEKVTRLMMILKDSGIENIGLLVGEK